MSKNTPFRYDYVGSFLRPETLKRARRDFEEGKISKEELTKVEDAAILGYTIYAQLQLTFFDFYVIMDAYHEKPDTI